MPTPRAATGGSPQYPERRRPGRQGLNLVDVVERLLPTAQATRRGSQHPDVRRAGGHAVTLNDVTEHLLPTPTAVAYGSNRSASDGAAVRPSLNSLIPTLIPASAAKLLPTPTGRDWKGPNQRSDDSCLSGALLPTPKATDGTHGGPHQRGSSGDLMLPSAVHLLPTPVTTDARGARNATAHRSTGNETPHTGKTLTDALLPTPSVADGTGGHRSRSGARAHELLLPGLAVSLQQQIDWGIYEAAIRRWAQVLGRTAPAPTEPAPRGGRRLSPVLTEWMLGWPGGWVTDPVIWAAWKPGAARNAQLKLCGNGVVPQQAIAALRHLLAACSVLWA